MYGLVRIIFTCLFYRANVTPSWKPQLGMKFDNLDEAWDFWRYYGGRMGFSVRKRFTTRSKFDGVVTSCRYVCFKEGKKSADKIANLTKIVELKL